MRRYLCLALLFSTWLTAQAQDAYTSHHLDITFYSSTPLKDFKAYSTTGTSLINTAKQEVTFSVDIGSFVFYRLLMQEHFNRKYMESDRYPRASFRGHFTEPVDLSIKGKHAVKVQGMLEIRGKKQMREVDGFLTVSEGRIFLEAEFMVNSADHGIIIPESLKDQIAPDIRVQVRGEYAPSDQFAKKSRNPHGE